MAKRRKTKPLKNMRRCSCGCERLCNGHDILRVDCAIEYVKKLGYSLQYLIWEKPLQPWELKIKMEQQR